MTVTIDFNDTTTIYIHRVPKEELDKYADIYKAKIEAPSLGRYLSFELGNNRVTMFEASE